MKINYPKPKCFLELRFGPRSKLIVRNDSFNGKSDSRIIHRFICRMCRCLFSKSTFSDHYNKKVRRMNELLRKLLVSGVSQRRAAIILGVSHTSVVKKLRFLAE